MWLRFHLHWFGVCAIPMKWLRIIPRLKQSWLMWNVAWVVAHPSIYNCNFLKTIISFLVCTWKSTRTCTYGQILSRGNARLTWWEMSAEGGHGAKPDAWLIHVQYPGHNDTHIVKLRKCKKSHFLRFQNLKNEGNLCPNFYKFFGLCRFFGRSRKAILSYRGGVLNLCALPSETKLRNFVPSISLKMFPFRPDHFDL